MVLINMHAMGRFCCVSKKRTKDMDDHENHYYYLDVGKETSVDNIKHAYASLKAVHESLNSRVLKLEDEKSTLIAKVHILEMQKQQWEAEKVKQQMMIQQALTRQNSTSNKYLQENAALRVEIRTLREKCNKFNKGK